MNILHLIPYPIGNAHHGGQIRSREINKMLRSTGASVLTIEIFDGRVYPKEKSAVDLSEAIAEQNQCFDWRLSDFAMGKSFAEHEPTFSMFRKMLPDNIDLIVVEEPWLGGAALRLLEDFPLAKILYSSHNVESVAKARMLSEAKVDDVERQVQAVKTLEAHLVSEAAAIVSVTEADAAIYREWCRHPVIVAMNGTSNRRRSHLAGVYHKWIDPDCRYGLFAASGHPPNVRGFLDLMMVSATSLRSDERLVVIGSVCDAVYPHVVGSQIPYVLRDRLCLLGKVSDFELDCLFANASLIALPVPYGGGSNLKTAEAIVSGKPIAATTMAFRGVEGFIGAPGVHIGDDQPSFQKALRSAFDESGKDFIRNGADSFLWGNTLEPFVAAVHELAAVASATGLSSGRPRHYAGEAPSI